MQIPQDKILEMIRSRVDHSPHHGRRGAAHHDRRTSGTRRTGTASGRRPTPRRSARRPAEWTGWSTTPSPTTSRPSPARCIRGPIDGYLGTGPGGNQQRTEHHRRYGDHRPARPDTT